MSVPVPHALVSTQDYTVLKKSANLVRKEYFPLLLKLWGKSIFVFFFIASEVEIHIHTHIASL